MVSPAATKSAHIAGAEASPMTSLLASVAPVLELGAIKIWLHWSWEIIAIGTGTEGPLRPWSFRPILKVSMLLSLSFTMSTAEAKDRRWGDTQEG